MTQSATLIRRQVCAPRPIGGRGWAPLNLDPSSARVHRSSSSDASLIDFQLVNIFIVSYCFYFRSCSLRDV